MSDWLTEAYQNQPRSLRFYRKTISCDSNGNRMSIACQGLLHFSGTFNQTPVHRKPAKVDDYKKKTKGDPVKRCHGAWMMETVMYYHGDLDDRRHNNALITGQFVTGRYITGMLISENQELIWVLPF